MYCVCVCPAVSNCMEVSPSYVPGSEYARHERVESSNNITAVFLKKKGKRKRLDRREGGCEMNEWQSGRWDARKKKDAFSNTYNRADISCQLNSRVLSFHIDMIMVLRNTLLHPLRTVKYDLVITSNEMWTMIKLFWF